MSSGASTEDDLSRKDTDPSKDDKEPRDQYEENEQGDSDTAQLLIQHNEEASDSEPEDPKGIVYTRDNPVYKYTRRVLAVLAFIVIFGLLAAAITLIAVSPRCNEGSLPWWKTTVIYQCYPRSFQDSDGDGNGDLVGIQQRVPYFVDVGIKAIWLNPIFKSPQRDNGYDISNYTDVDPLYGTMDNLSSLLSELHNNNIKLILDFVPNHSSDEHPWFIESRSSKTNLKRDWYVWADGMNGGPPNNWISVFGGSAWTLDNTTNQYYLHQFSEFQPDLNFNNSEVQDAMLDILKFWYDFGVDGFRIDAVKHLLEDPKLNNESRNPDFPTANCTTNITSPNCYNSLVHNLTTNYPGIHDIIREWRKVVDSYPGNRFIVGEIYDPIDVTMTYYGENDDEFNFPFNFLLLGNSEWTGTEVSELVELWLDNMPDGAWPNWVLGNHDNPRIASKAGLYLARALNVLLLTLPGTPTTYYGEELFMTDVDVPDSKKHDKYGGRDTERTPMQWNTTANAGFTTSNNPWLPVADNFSTYNVEVESSSNATASMLDLYKQLVDLRSNNEALQYSKYEELLNNTEVFAYRRYQDSEGVQFIIVVNFSQKSVIVSLGEVKDFTDPKTVISTHSEELGSIDLNNTSLAMGEAIVIRGRGKDACSV